MPTYFISPQGDARARLGDDELALQLGNLTALSFASFDGVVQPSPAKSAWYMARPGMDPELSAVAFHDGRIVSNLYVTRMRFPVGGKMLDVGMIDTVMTHPQHRGQGLAKRLLERALAGLRAGGADLAALYTPAGSLPFAIYQKMGFRPQRVALLWTCEREATTVDAPQTQAPDATAARALINAFNGGKDGFVTVDEALWSWRKGQRPPHMPISIAAVRRGERLAGTVTFCPVELVEKGSTKRYIYMTDLGLEGAGAAETFAELLQASPAGERWIMLAADNDLALQALLQAHGFAPTPGETSLLYPLHTKAERALREMRAPWYVLPESVVGV